MQLPIDLRKHSAISRGIFVPQTLSSLIMSEIRRGPEGRRRKAERNHHSWRGCRSALFMTVHGEIAIAPEAFMNNAG
jgi:hypothetical protein